MELTVIDKDMFRATREAWLASASRSTHEAFLAEYEQLFDVIEEGDGIGSLEGRLNVAIYYGILDNGVVKALVQMLQSERGSDIWIKMTDIHMCPEIELEVDIAASTADRLRVFTTALLGVFALTKQVARADTIKVYGRTDALITFLRGMHDALAVMSSLGNMPGINVSIEGRWLVFRTSK